MARGNPASLRGAAERKHQAATQRAQIALDTISASGDPISFPGLARAAGVSIDFLCRSPLRAALSISVLTGSALARPKPPVRGVDTREDEGGGDGSPSGPSQKVTVYALPAGR